MTTGRKAIYRFNKISIYQQHFSQTYIILKFVWTHKKPQRAKAILKKKNRTRSSTIPDFQLYCKAVVMKIIQYWHKNRHMDQEQNRGPRNKPAVIRLINLQQRRQEYAMGKRLLTKRFWENWTLRACLEVLAGERSYSCTLDRRSVLLYRGWSSSSTEHPASGGTHMEQ